VLKPTATIVRMTYINLSHDAYDAVDEGAHRRICIGRGTRAPENRVKLIRVIEEHLETSGKQAIEKGWGCHEGIE
jgi:hypothetical protein